MSEKKKPVAAKTNERRMSKPQVPKTVTSSTSSEGTAAVTQPLNSQKQLSSFEAAMRLFHARNLKDARALYEIAAGGPERDVAQRARLHIAMCDRRLEHAAPTLQTAEENYNYAVALLNTRNGAEARQYLEKALEMEPEADHVHYALALARALGGDVAGAAEHLRRAIELEPRNRIIARQDADFASLANQPAFDALLHPEKKSW